MSMQETISAERIHIGFFGLRNAGKSSVVNAVTGQSLSLVSEIKGTTTDPVKKAMELLPLGPVVIVDTPGLDDEGTLGEMRVERARQILRQIHLAVLVTDGTTKLSEMEQALIEEFQNRKLPFLIVYNKSDLLTYPLLLQENELLVSAKTGAGIPELKERLARLAPQARQERKLVGDLITAGDLVVLVVPIDKAAPKGRLILPQQQTIRDILDHGAMAVVCRDHELEQTLRNLGRKPKLVITDSQVFGPVSQLVPDDILLTSFSILFARYKGSLETAVQGAAALSRLQNGDHVLISEGCTHHRQCEDIGTQKIPRWVEAYTEKKLVFSFTSGGEFPHDLSPYALVIHCGGCMLNEKEMGYRTQHAIDANVSITNYGIAIAQMHGILRRSLEPFAELLHILEEK